MRSLTIITALLLSVVHVIASVKHEKICFGEENGVSSDHITEIVQDKNGFIWLSTWNGLNRFDGREFVVFKTRPGDHGSLSSDRIRNVAVNDRNPNILNCRTDNEWFFFSLNTGKFTRPSKAQSKQLERHHGHGNGVANRQNGSLKFILRDRQGLLWTVENGRLTLERPATKYADRLNFPISSDVKCIFRDRNCNYWITSKEDKAVRVFTLGSSTPLYLSASGRLVKGYTPFSTPVYTVFQSKDGDIWLGCKPGGLYRLHKLNGGYNIQHINGSDKLNVYDISEDKRGRLWLATMGNGIVCLNQNRFTCFHVGKDNKVRRIYLLPDDILLATSTEGLVSLNIKNPSKVYLNHREENRRESLSSSACMSIAKLNGHYFVATESGGIDEITSNNLLCSHLSFRHYNTENGLGSDVVLSMTPWRQELLAVSSCRLMLLNPKTGECRNFDSHFFHEYLRFSDAQPVLMSNGKWIIGLKDGAITLPNSVLAPDSYRPNLVLTSVTIGNKPTIYAANNIKHLSLQKDERSLVITFAALDFRSPEDIKYAYRIDGNSAWHYLGNNSTVVLPRLSPGKFTLQLRCTNAGGTWCPNIRSIFVDVKPTFTETLWFDLIIFFLLLFLLASSVWVRNYIRRIKRNQQETLAAYLALIEKSNKQDKTADIADEKSTQHTSTMSESDKAFMDRVIKYVEEHLSDSDADIHDMARKAAVSQAGLNRKMKTLVGLTPAEFIREARLKHACNMLKNTQASIAEVAYACGFSDPKYFSRVFRQSVGVSPSQYRSGE